MRRYCEVAIRMIVDDTNEKDISDLIYKAIHSSPLIDAGEVDIGVQLLDPIEVDPVSKFAIPLKPIPSCDGKACFRIVYDSSRA